MTDREKEVTRSYTLFRSTVINQSGSFWIPIRVEFFLVNCSLHFRDSLAYHWPSTQMFLRLRHAFLFPFGWGVVGGGGGGEGRSPKRTPAWEASVSVIPY